MNCHRQAAAETRLRLALDSIQQAQQLIELATQALSGVEGMRSQWSRLGSLSDGLTQAWFAVRAGANRLQRTRHLETLDRQ